MVRLYVLNKFRQITFTDQKNNEIGVTIVKAKVTDTKATINENIIIGKAIQIGKVITSITIGITPLGLKRHTNLVFRLFILFSSKI